MNSRRQSDLLALGEVRPLRPSLGYGTVYRRVTRYSFCQLIWLIRRLEFKIDALGQGKQSIRFWGCFTSKTGLVCWLHGWLGGWCLTALSAQQSYMVPCKNTSLLKILIADRKLKYVV